MQWVQWHLWRNDTLGYHLTNVALHLLSAFLLWRLFRQLGVRLAWLGALPPVPSHPDGGRVGSLDIAEAQGRALAAAAAAGDEATMWKFDLG